MQIFDEILKQYMQLVSINSQYKRNLQSLNFNKSLLSVENDAEIITSNTTLDTQPKTTEIYYNYNENLSNIKDFYEKWSLMLGVTTEILTLRLELFCYEFKRYEI